MFEAKLTEGHILKKIVEAIKDLVTDVNIDVSPSGKLMIELLIGLMQVSHSKPWTPPMSHSSPST